MTILNLIKLPSHLQADAFERFARTRYLPALRTESTREGQLHAVRLLRRRREHESDPLDLDTEFVLLWEWSGVPIEMPRVAEPGIQQLFDAFQSRITRLGDFVTVGTLVTETP